MLVFALTACGPAVEVMPEDDGMAGTGGPGPVTATFTTGGTTTSSSTSSTTMPPIPPDSTTMPDDCITTGCDDDDAGDDEHGDFLLEPDGSPCGSHAACDTWGQDCNKGEKCTATDYCATEGVWSATICVPVDPDPGQPGDPCTVEDTRTSGRDTCDFDSMCWDIDPETLMGTCVPRCQGSQNNPLCDDPNNTCLISNNGVLNLCLPACDPLTSDCPTGQSCHPIDEGTNHFVCMPDGAPVRVGPLTPTECPPGETAVPDEHLPSQCEDDELCCTPYCSLSAPDCTNALDCQPWHEPRLGILIDVGVCVDP